MDDVTDALLHTFNFRNELLVLFCETKVLHIVLIGQVPMVVIPLKVFVAVASGCLHLLPNLTGLHTIVIQLQKGVREALETLIEIVWILKVRVMHIQLCECESSVDEILETCRLLRDNICRALCEPADNGFRLLHVAIGPENRDGHLNLCKMLHRVQEVGQFKICRRPDKLVQVHNQEPLGLLYHRKEIVAIHSPLTTEIAPPGSWNQGHEPLIYIGLQFRNTCVRALVIHQIEVVCPMQEVVLYPFYDCVLLVLEDGPH